MILQYATDQGRQLAAQFAHHAFDDDVLDIMKSFVNQLVSKREALCTQLGFQLDEFVSRRVVS